MLLGDNIFEIIIQSLYGYADYFYYLFFGGIWGFGAGGHGSNGGKEEAPEYLTIENMYPLYANGTVAGSYKEDLVYSPHQHYWNSWTNFWGSDTSRHDDYATYKETLYFGTDILGSVRAATDGYARLSGNISYDAFGSPYSRSGTFLNSESLDFGYLGKPYNATTELYDYGFRDYSPQTARFTTADPVRDGRNWYAYVLNDPVNFVDWWGLTKSESDKKNNIKYKQNNIMSPIVANEAEEKVVYYSWEWYIGSRTINDNKTGNNKADDFIKSETMNSKPYKKSEKKFDTYEKAFADARDTAYNFSFQRTGPPIKYNYDENIENTNFEINIFLSLLPQGDGSHDEVYEVNRWIVVEEQEKE